MLKRRMLVLAIGVAGAFAAYALLKLFYPSGDSFFYFLVGVLSGVIRELADMLLTPEPPPPPPPPDRQIGFDLHPAAATLILLFGHLLAAGLAQLGLIGVQSSLQTQIDGIDQAAFQHISLVMAGALGAVAALAIYGAAFFVGFCMSRMRYLPYLMAMALSGLVLLTAAWLHTDPAMMSVREALADIAAGARGAAQTAAFNTLAMWVFTGVALNGLSLLVWIAFGLLGRLVRHRLLRIA